MTRQPSKSSNIRVRLSQPLSQRPVALKRNITIRAQGSKGRLSQVVQHLEDVDDEMPELEDIEESDDEEDSDDEDEDLDLDEGREEDDVNLDGLDDSNRTSTGTSNPESLEMPKKPPVRSCLSNTFMFLTLFSPVPFKIGCPIVRDTLTCCWSRKLLTVTWPTVVMQTRFSNAKIVSVT